MTLTLVVLGVEKMHFDSVYADELILIANPEARWGGYGKIANHFLQTAHGDVLGIIHADTLLSQEVCDALTDVAMSGAVTGIVGATETGNIWSRDVREPTPVSTLDSCCVFVRKDSKLRFDQVIFDSFHCCVEDFCLLAHSIGIPVLVVPGWSMHPYPERKNVKHWSPDAHKVAKEFLREKWSGVNFFTT